MACLIENDVNSLLEFKEYHTKIFSNNLLKDANVKLGLDGVNNIIDDNYDTNCEFVPSDDESSVLIELPEVRTFNLLCLQEDIRVGQRVEAFKLEAKQNDGTWRTVANGTTIGYKRIIRFDNTTAKELRFTVEESRLNPAIAEIGLYLCE
jgi:F5/8 type C domain.